MERRHLLFGVSGSLAILAGCTSGLEGTTEDPSDETEAPDKEFPKVNTLLEEHILELRDSSFEATEYREDAFSTGDSQVRIDRTIRGSEAGTLLIGDDIAQNISSDRPQRVWFTDHARVNRATHTHYPEGVTPPIIDVSSVQEIIGLLSFEPVEVTDEEKPAAVFEATGPSESVPEDVDLRTVDGTVEIMETGYIRRIEIEIEVASNADGDETQTAAYEYEVTDVGTTEVTPPDFVENALRVEGYLTDDRSAVRLEHAGGSTVEANTRLTFQDKEYIASADRDGPSFPAEFAEGDTAYIYWSSETEAAIRMGQKPSTVAREIALPTDGNGRIVYLEEEAGPGPERFAVRFHIRA